MTSFNYVPLEYAIKEHDFIIESSGGLTGIKERGHIESVLELVQNDDYYPGFLDKMCHIVYGLNKNHAFQDGNKRTSLVVSSFFLEINDQEHLIKQYTKGMEDVVVWVANNSINKETLRELIEFILYEDASIVSYFAFEAAKYREFIAKEVPDISPDLLKRMIDCWLSDEMVLTDDVELEVLDCIASSDLSELEEE